MQARALAKLMMTMMMMMTMKASLKKVDIPILFVLYLRCKYSHLYVHGSIWHPSVIFHEADHCLVINIQQFSRYLNEELLQKNIFSS